MVTAKQLRRRIEPVGPDDGARFFVDAYLPEVVGVAQRLAEGAAEEECAVDVADESVVESHAETVVVERLGVGDSKHAVMLRQRLDRNQRLQRLGALPVVCELLRMRACPFADEAQSARRQRPVEDADGFKLDLGEMLPVLSVEVRRGMVGSIHPDHDPVEGGETGHEAIVEEAAVAMTPCVPAGVGPR